MPARAFAIATRVALVLALFATAPALALAGQVRVSHIDGPPVEGKVDKVEDNTLSLRDLTGDGPRTLNLKRVEEILYPNQQDSEPIPERYPLRLYLSSGDVLIGRVVRETDSGLGFVFESFAFGEVEIDLEWVMRLDVIAAVDALGFKEDPLIAESEDDGLYWRRPVGDVSAGFAAAITPTGIAFEDNAGILGAEVPYGEMLVATRHLFLGPLAQPNEFQVLVSCRSGERFTGKLLKTEGRRYLIQSYVLKLAETDDRPAGPVTITVHEDRIARMTFSHGSFAYLSDMTPKAAPGTNKPAVIEYPFFGGERAMPRDPDEYWWHYRRDRAVGGGELTLRDENKRRVVYAKGLGCHSYCRITFELNAQFNQFLAEIGVDEAATGAGSVVFRVFADSETEPRFDSGVVRRSAAAQSIAIDVTGVRYLHLEVDFGDNGDIQDHANWARARIIRKD